MYSAFKIANEKMYLLEEERDFFRSQVMKLNGDINGMLEENKSLKKKMADLSVETENYRIISISNNIKNQTTKRRFKNCIMREIKWPFFRGNLQCLF